MNITTNNQPRQLVSFHDLPEKVKPDFDYVEGDDRFSYRFFTYKGNWYDANEFVVCGLETEFRYMGWHGVQSETFFSGILIKYMPGHENVIVGRYYN